MKKLLVIIVVFIALPTIGRAAYDDVTLTTDADISVGGATFDISGAPAYIESINVRASDFIVTLVPTSTAASVFKVSSPNRYQFNHSVTPSSGYIDSEICNSSESSIKFSPQSGLTINVTVTPQVGTVCTDSGSSGGSPSGGGGPSATPPKPKTIKPPLVVIPPDNNGAPRSLVSLPPFTKSLGLGTKDADVLRLQRFLNTDPATQIASSGLGSPGQETDYFGSLTEKAVQKFQLKHGIVVSASDPGYGLVGPKTRV